MLKKKHIFILLLLMVGLLTISCASANENTTDIITNDDIGADDVATAIEEDPTINAADEIETQETLSSENNDNKLSMDETEEILESPSYYDYSVWVDDSTIHNWQKESIIIHVDPSTGYYAYDFYIKFFDSEDNEIHSQNIYNTNPYTSIKYNIPAYDFDPGTYTIKLVNYEDGELMDTATLTVISDPFYAVFSAGNYNAYYNSGVTYTIRVTEKGTTSGLSGVSVKIVFTNSKKTVTKYYTSDSNGYIKFVPPVGVGTYSVTISSNNAHVIATALKKTATVKKSSVTMKAYKAKAYQGYKLTLKATVKSQGKNVNEGKVTFKINGKSYTVAVKNGVATKKIKLKKVKSYKYTATYKGDNFNSKKVKAKAVVKKRYATKITVKNQKGYMGNKKTITVKVTTKSGKKVKSGYIDVGGTGTYSKVKNGKAKLYVSFSGNYQGYSGLTLYYKKSVSSKYKLKYIPSSLKYKSSKKKIKITSKFRCDMCGKKSSHSHYINGYKIKIHVY
ncbi:MAG: Ig-like domain repeat protein [Methanobrevibacter thaueri]|uniref:Ig-like domain-containing protein n=1 Tax=Methanobrevibacter thaueri TaxID=190975 RepID=UPI0026E993B4|nr:Ig-like domain-containing protein [Methanobrevibacter thaueri]MBE6496545.1 Ig-like domain repeat protein [Methanobrevibacter thaueri]